MGQAPEPAPITTKKESSPEASEHGEAKPNASPPMLPSERQLFIGNLPFEVQWQDLKDLLRNAGNILRADIAIGPDGKSRGYGTALFANAEEARRAITMYDGYVFNGRAIRVHLDKFAPPMAPSLPASVASAVMPGSGSIMPALPPNALMHRGSQDYSTIPHAHMYNFMPSHMMRNPAHMMANPYGYPMMDKAFMQQQPNQQYLHQMQMMQMMAQSGHAMVMPAQPMIPPTSSTDNATAATPATPTATTSTATAPTSEEGFYRPSHPF
jgi:hypothetical protein